MCLAYTTFVNQIVQQNGYEQVAFVARDGYTLTKIFNLIKDADVINSYIYAPAS